MARFVKGDVVVVPFPFSDLTHAKRRPALVVAEADGSALLLCQITSQAARDCYAVRLNDADFESGSLHKSSHIRTNRVFTADGGIVLYAAGRLRRAKTDEAVETLVALLRGS